MKLYGTDIQSLVLYNSFQNWLKILASINYLMLVHGKVTFMVRMRYPVILTLIVAGV